MEYIELPPELSQWQNLVDLTRNHPRFQSEYSFSNIDDFWIQPREHGDWCSGNPHVLAMDCEMAVVQKEDKLDKALLRLSVINVEDMSQVLIDTLVVPNDPIVDYVSNINGITEEDMKNCCFTFDHAQVAMLKICCNRTLLIGHSLISDLSSIKLFHTVVVDTSFLYGLVLQPTHSPGLKDLAKFVLQKDMPDIHDSVNDARITAEVALHSLCFGIESPIPRCCPPRSREARLFMHRIPKDINKEFLLKLINDFTSIVPFEVSELKSGKSNFLMGTISFISSHHANLAFDYLPSPVTFDLTCKRQKRVFYRQGKKNGFFFITKSVVDVEYQRLCAERGASIQEKDSSELNKT